MDPALEEADYGNSDDEAVSSDDEMERLGKRLPRHRYTTVDDEDNKEERGYRHRTREEATYGVFMEDSDQDDSRRQRRKRPASKPLFRREQQSRAKSSSLTAPMFVQGDTLQDEEMAETPAADSQEAVKDKSPVSESQAPVAETPPEPPTEQELKLQQQRKEANQQFLNLMDRAKRKRARPLSSSSNRETDAPGTSSVKTFTSATKAEPAAAGLGSTSTRTAGLGLGMTGDSMGAPGIGLGMSTGRGLGMSPAAPPRRDLKLGTWEKHTKGIGMKLLSKMGYKGSGGLGSKRREEAKKTGISRAVEVKVRPANLGLGFGGFREASALKVNRQLEAEVRGVKAPEPEPVQTKQRHPSSVSNAMPASALPTNAELLKNSSWQKGSREVSRKKEKQKRVVIPYDQLLESQKQAQQTTKIVDLRGPVATQVVEEETVGPPALGEELLHNVTLLLTTHESKLHSHSQFASAAEQKLNSLQTEVTDLQQQTATIQERQQKMERASQIMESYDLQIPKGFGDQSQLDAALGVVEDLASVFSQEDRKSLKFDSVLAPSLLGDALQATLKKWNPLRQQSTEVAVSLVKSIANIQLSLDAESVGSLKRSLFRKYILPKIQKAYDSAHWDALSQTETGVAFYERLVDVVKAGLESEITDGEASDDEHVERRSMRDIIRRTVIFETVHPKLERTLANWKPSVDESGTRLVNPPHLWILPWVPFLDHPGILPTIMAQCKRRVESTVSVLSRKMKDNRTFLEAFQSTLRPWAKAFKTSSVYDLTSKFAGERLASLLGQGKSESFGVDTDLVFRFYEGGLLSSVDFLSLLEGDILRRCVVKAYAQVTSSEGSVEACARSYRGWKGDLESLAKSYASGRQVLQKDEVVARCFLAMLRMMEARVQSDAAALERLEPSALSYSQIRSRRLRERQRDAEVELLRTERGKNDYETQTRARFVRQGYNKPTFREVVEDFATAESIPFQPRSGARSMVDGKQVFLFGDIPMYLESDVIFVHEGSNQWEPLSLESLLDRAKQKGF
jgi:tuftelin-interacting protein 11